MLPLSSSPHSARAPYSHVEECHAAKVYPLFEQRLVTKRVSRYVRHVLQSSYHEVRSLDARFHLPVRGAESAASPPSSLHFAENLQLSLSSRNASNNVTVGSRRCEHEARLMNSSSSFITAKMALKQRRNHVPRRLFSRRCGMRGWGVCKKGRAKYR